MTEHTPEETTLGQKVVDLSTKASEKAADAALAAADIIDSVDTEQIGKHARTIKDKTQLWVWDHRVEVGAAVFFIAGAWVGRRGVRRAVAKALKNHKPEGLTYFEMWGFEPNGNHVVLPPVEWDQLDKMSKYGNKLTYECGSHMVELGVRPGL